MVSIEMLEVKIENLVFPPEIIELIEFHRNEIRIHLCDFTLGDNHEKFKKWINLVGTYDKKQVELVTIGKNSLEGKYYFSCTPSPGIPGRIADNIDIRLHKVPEEGL